jgi:hypothetical protein
MLAGPNSASGLFSVLYAVECQVEFVCKLVSPLNENLMIDCPCVETTSPGDPGGG